MFYNLICSIIIEIAKGVFAGQIVNDHLNPIHLAIATNGYRIQSQTLHIPDRIGFFSSGPPRLQVYQASMFFLLIMGPCYSIISAAFVVFVVRRNSIKIAAFMLSITVAQTIAIWALVCFDRHRAPGYEWEDWKA
ncbi:hypothetical protein BU16DRAFT_308438 [Lophium mytilinum]|uniref:Uncharacterized protein n=1 Tax=Lophium mytilinum TaxID=390894 RepID=A0A6A6R2E7_9PEZI|nr:hypothetical protein BU16DRAFT_308438 [Lophium mytilinum]